MRQHPYARSVTALLQDPIDAMGYTLWGCHFVTQPDQILQVFIDASQGVGVEDCQKVAQHIQGVLDVADIISGAYHLEVSSPGLDRMLFTVEQFKHHQGAQIEVKLLEKQEGRWRWYGQLELVEHDTIELRTEHEQVLSIAYDDMKSARLLPQW